LLKAPSRAKTHIEIIVDDHHRRIAASALTLDLNHGELAILRRFSGLNPAKVAACRFQDFGGAAEHAWRRSAHLHKILANWVTKNIKHPPLTRQDDNAAGILSMYGPVEHGVERRDFVHSHGLHFEQLRHVVHNADARPSLVLSLAEVEEGNGGCLLVLWWIMCDDFIGAFKVLRCELERNLGGGVRRSENRDKMYENTPGLLCGLSLCCNVDNGGERPYVYERRRGQTTKRASERRDKDVERWRVGAARRAAEKGLASLAAASMVNNVRSWTV
jgi:hypothetical protein